MVVSYWLVMLIVRDGGRIVLAGDIVRDGGRIVLAGDVDCEGWWSYRIGW